MARRHGDLNKLTIRMKRAMDDCMDLMESKGVACPGVKGKDDTWLREPEIVQSPGEYLLWLAGSDPAVFSRIWNKMLPTTVEAPDGGLSVAMLLAGSVRPEAEQILDVEAAESRPAALPGPGPTGEAPNGHGPSEGLSGAPAGGENGLGPSQGVAGHSREG